MITTKQIAEVRRLIEEEGHNLMYATRLVGVSYNAAYWYLMRMGVQLPPRRNGPDKLSQYGAYNRKTVNWWPWAPAER